MVVELGFKPAVYPLKAPSPWGSGKELKLAWVGAGRWPTPAKVNTQALRGTLSSWQPPPPPSSHLGHTSCSPWGKVHTCTFRRVWFLRGQMGHPQPGPLHLANIPIFQKRTLRPREGQ